jgi:hypothetical protein
MSLRFLEWPFRESALKEAFRGHWLLLSLPATPVSSIDCLVFNAL